MKYTEIRYDGQKKTVCHRQGPKPNLRMPSYTKCSIPFSQGEGFGQPVRPCLLLALFSNHHAPFLFHSICFCEFFWLSMADSTILRPELKHSISRSCWPEKKSKYRFENEKELFHYLSIYFSHSGTYFDMLISTEWLFRALQLGLFLMSASLEVIQSCTNTPLLQTI